MTARTKTKVSLKYKTKYRVRNWAAYEEALRKRGDITVWFDEEAICAWKAPPSGRPGGPRKYSDLAIVTTLTLRTVFHLPLRQTEGFVASLMPDGVYVTGADGTPSFVRAPQLTDDEVQRVEMCTGKSGHTKE